jgi:hypothetical protein
MPLFNITLAPTLRDEIIAT